MRLVSIAARLPDDSRVEPEEEKKMQSLKDKNILLLTQLLKPLTSLVSSPAIVISNGVCGHLH